MAPRNQDMISRQGVSVWLNADLDLLWNRVRHKDTRPLLRTENPYETLRGIYQARTPVYANADLAISVQPKFSIEETASLVIDALLTRPDVLEEIS